MTSVIVTLAAYDPNDVKPGWLAFWIVIALVVATFLLWRSMNTQLRKIKAPYRDELEESAPSGRVQDGASSGKVGDSTRSPVDHVDDENDGSSSAS